MGVLLLTSGDELLLQDGVDAILLQLDDSSQPSCVYLTLAVPSVNVTLDQASVSIDMADPSVTITMERC